MDNWPLYINDQGVVRCYYGDCDHTFEYIGRRTTFGEFSAELKCHITEDHEIVEERCAAHHDILPCISCDGGVF